jgi:hypothetical protein
MRTRQHGASVLWTLFTVLLLALGTALYIGLSQIPDVPVTLVIEGERVFDGMNLPRLMPAERAALAFGLVLVVLVVTLIVPLALIAVLAAVAIALVAGLGVPVLAIAAVLAVLAAPVIAVWALLRWALRRDKAASASATMPR